MKNIKGSYILFICLALVCSMLGACSKGKTSEDKVTLTEFTPGKYPCKASGYGGAIEVEVGLAKDRIEKINIFN